MQKNRFFVLVLVLGGLVSSLVADETIPVDPEPRWWRGNLHTHTFWSDGNDFPEMAAEWYRTQGYNFLALSDHNILSEGERWMRRDAIVKRGGEAALEKYRARFGSHWVETRGEAGTETGADSLEVRLKPLNEFRALVEERGTFIMIAGEEITDKVAGKPVHLNATNLKELIQPMGGVTVREAMERNLSAATEQAVRTGREILVHLNHPNYNFAISAEDLAHVVSERFFEVYNGHQGVKHLGDGDHPGVERLWDIANTLRLAGLGAAPLYGLATDDSHHYHGKEVSPPGRGWIQVRARHLTPESLIRSMKRGDFYASSGVRLRDVRYLKESRALELEIEPRPDTEFTTEFIGTLEQSDEIGAVLSRVEGLSARYELSGKELYVRAVVTSTRLHPNPSFDGQREQAWTQPVGWETRIAR